MRRSFDGLSLAAKEYFEEDPRTGALFVFVNKKKNRVKVLWFEANSCCLLYKRLHHARFVLPEARLIDGKMLALLLRGVETSRR
jgi:transposase